MAVGLKSVSRGVGEPGLEVREKVWQRQVEWFQKLTDGEDMRSSRVLRPRASPSGVWGLSLLLESLGGGCHRNMLEKELEGPLC